MSQARHPILDPALRAVQWSVRHPRTVIGLALAAVALALLSFSRVRVSASLHAMLGESSSVGAAMQRISGQYHAADSLLLMADLPPGDHPDGRTELLRFAASFQAAAASDPDAKEVIAYVRSGQEPELARFAREVMLPSAAYYLSDAGLTELVARLDCDEIGRQIARNEALVAAPGPAGSTLSSNVLRDPLRLFELVPPSMAGAGASAMSLEQSTNEPEWSRDRRAILIRVGGTRPPGELAAARRLVDVVERLARGANAGGLSLRFAGAAPVAAHSSGVIKADSIVSTIASVTLVALLFALFYRRALASALIGGVAAAGILVGLGVHALFVREVSPLAAVVGALLAGLGTDYGIHFLSHYDEHRARGMDASASAVETSRTMLLPIATNCFTSIFGFASLWPSPIRMLRDFSTMGAAGLVGALVAVFALMPALLRIVDRRVAVPLAAPARMAKLTDSVVARPGRWLGAALGVLCVLAAGAITRGSGLEFEPDLTVMHPRPSPPLDAAAAIADRFGEGGEFVPVEVRAASTSELLGTAHRLTDELLARSDVGVRAVLGLQVLIPAPGAEERVRRALATLDPESVRACFDRRVNESAFDLDSYGQYRRFLGDLVAAAHCPTVADLLRYPALAERIFPAGSGAEPTSTVLVIRLAEPLTDRAQRTRVITALAETTRQFPGVTLAGLPAVSEELEQATREGLPASVALSITLVVGWLWLVFRRARLVALALIPLLFAAGATVCFMMATGAKFNPINSVAIPLLDGIAVDAGVFLVSAARSHSASREELRVHLRATTHAVMLAVLTTVTAFAALCFSHTPAIRSLGMVSAVGAAASMFGALFVLMPLLVRSAPAVGRGTSGHP